MRMFPVPPQLLLLPLLLAATARAQKDPNVINGQAIVHLFEWKWVDIAAECENFLSPRGYGGVQISPPNEYVLAWTDEAQRPWWERYQPVSYTIASRSGDEGDFRDMVNRCNQVGVRIYVDAVINHMTGGWPIGTPGVGGGSFDSGSESYPGVPYSYLDFNDGNCRTASGNIESYNDDADQIRNCRLDGLLDVNQGKDYVRQMISGYMNKVIDMGVAGFRIDAAKHMWPGDLEILYRSLNDLRSDIFGTGVRPFIFQEVIDLGNEPVTAEQYTGLGRVTEFFYGKYLSEAMHGGNQFKYFNNFGEGWGMLPRSDSLVFVDNHDNQRRRDPNDPPILTFRTPRWYKMGVGFMLAWPYGFTRVMSSYYWDEYLVDGKDINSWIGPPHDDEYNIVSPVFAVDDSCSNDWVCEHRWRQIYNMVEFRNVAHGTDQNDWWDNGNNQIAFCRGNKGFFAFNNDNYDLTETLQTCLSAGTYCDVISGSKTGGRCTGKTVTVSDAGTAYVEVKTTDYDGILAIHQKSKL